MRNASDGYLTGFLVPDEEREGSKDTPEDDHHILSKLFARNAARSRT